MPDAEVPVLIVGGGGCGLTASCCLSDMAIPHVLVERHPDTSHLPKAHYLNARTLEIFRQHGIADAVYAAGAPMENMAYIEWRTSIGGDGPLQDKMVGRVECFGGGELREVYERDSACPSTNLPQLRLEPLLRRAAEERNPGGVRFNHELVDFQQQDEGVTATIRDRVSEERYAVRARYVIGADGGKTLGPRLGVEMQGVTNLMDVVSTHFSADLSEYMRDEVLITFFVPPWGGGHSHGGAMVQMGPTWGRRSEEWTVHLTFLPNDESRMDEAALPDRIRRLLGVPDLEMDIHRVSHWILDRVVADKYRVGDIFLAGDACHRRPPTTGLGLNTSIQDGHNLAWKLAAVLDGVAGPGLLDSYESERRPVGIINADWALLANSNHHLIDAAIGLIQGAPEEQNVATLEFFFSDTPMAETMRTRADIVLQTQRVEFQAHNIEIGFRYDEGALIPDGSDPPARDPLGATYSPVTRPGHRLPHAWLERGGERISTQDLVKPGHFVLLTGSAGRAWAEAAQDAAHTLGIPLHAYVVGPDGDCIDVEGRWAEIREVADDGAVLVRPDQHVAWREPSLVPEPTKALEAALRTIVGGARQFEEAAR